MFTAILYGVAGTGLIISFFKDRKKTKMALKKAWKSFENILPQFLSVLLPPDRCTLHFRLQL